MDAYSEAHLFVAAVRVLQHRKDAPPTLEEVCELLQISVEMGNVIRRKLSAEKILESLEDPFGTKLVVADHLKIETLPRDEPDKKGLTSELAEFQAKRKRSEKKVAAIQAELEAKRKNMFAELESKLKQEIDKQKK